MRPDGLRVAVTGAAGFIGRAVVDRIDRGAIGAVADLRLNDLDPIDRADAVVIAGSYADAAVRDALIGDGVDLIFHLASLPGGASERDPALGRRVNLDGSIALFDAAAARGVPTIVYTSSIAALGAPTTTVSDATRLLPNGIYGTYKAMVELYLADLTRRGLVDGRSVRPAGIVARPRAAYAGFATAWMSELFHAAAAGAPLTVPTRADAHVWLQSLDVLADNIVHAALMPAEGLPRHRAWTLPATVGRIDTLVAALQRRTGSAAAVTYGDSPFDHPPLDARDALALGFRSDGDADALAAAVLALLAAGT